MSYDEIVNLFNSTCVSFSPVRTLTESRKKAITESMHAFSVDDVKVAFKIAESSSFLKGKNERNWTATFDWLIKSENMAKVLEGNFSDNTNRHCQKQPIWGCGEMGEAELEAIERVLIDQTSVSLQTQ